MNKRCRLAHSTSSSGSRPDHRCCLYIFSMKNLQPFTPQGCDKPVAMVSPNCSQSVLDVLENNWDKSSSGFGSHIYVEDLVENITDPEIIQEYWEEYSL